MKINKHRKHYLLKRKVFLKTKAFAELTGLSYDEARLRAIDIALSVERDRQELLNIKNAIDTYSVLTYLRHKYKA